MATAVSAKLNLRTVRDSVPFAELADFGETGDGEKMEAKRLLLCLWEDRYRLVYAMLPRCSIYELPKLGAVLSRTATTVHIRNNPGTIITYYYVNRFGLRRLDPERHPKRPQLLAMAYEFLDGVGAAYEDTDQSIYFKQGGTNEQGMCRVLITYKWMPYKIGVADSFTNTSDFADNGEQGPSNPGTVLAGGWCELPRYVSRTFKPASDAYKVPGASLVEFDTIHTGVRKVIPEPLDKILPKMHVTYKWWHVPTIPVTAYLLQGRVSAFQFFDYSALEQVAGNTRHCGDVLYLYPEISDPYSMVDGMRVRDITYHCILKQPANTLVYLHSRRGTPWLTGPPALYDGFVLPVRNIPEPAGNPFTYSPSLPESDGFYMYDFAWLESLFMLTTTKTTLTPDDI